MGYTHYWYRKKEIPEEKFMAFLHDFEIFLNAYPSQRSLIQGSRQNGEIYQGGILAFNGIGENSHETFVLEMEKNNVPDYELKYAKQNKGLFFDFCKTARKPYDTVVCAALIIAKKKLGSHISIASDGSDEPRMWAESKEMCQNALGYGDKFDFNEKGSATYRRNENLSYSV